MPVAHIENRSRTRVTVKNRDDLTRFFPFNKNDAAKLYFAELKAQGLKPAATVLDEAYLVRYKANGRRQTFTATSHDEAIAVKKRIEAEQHSGLFINYSKAHQTTFADLLTRYLHEEAPRKKGFLVIGYQINSWLQDVGLERQDIAAIHAAHPNPHNPALRIPKTTGRRMSSTCSAVAFIRKSFVAIGPEDFRDYIDERLQSAEPATVDRELDVFRAVCKTAIATWRIHVHMDPMAGLERPKYFNERDRRLRPGEEERLMEAAADEDKRWTERLLVDQHFENRPSSTKYQRLIAIQEARDVVQQGHGLIPMLSTFLQFQLMTGARRSETLKLTWAHVDLERQAAFLPETKNGRPRTLPLRLDLVALLQQLPRTGEYVFPIPADYLRNAWSRMCQAAGIETEGEGRLRIHDLRHEAISRVAEVGSQTPGGFSLLDLQAFSGHRDPRMLMRYTHLTPTGLARRLDLAFSQKGLKDGTTTVHKGRMRLTTAAQQSMQELMTLPLSNQIADNGFEIAQLATVEQAHKTLPSNVVSFHNYRKAAAA